MRSVLSSPIFALLKRIRHFVGVDRAVFYSILIRAFSTAGSLVTVPLILTRLTLIEQGFYYTFGSILALQIFLEMGFGAVAVQMIAHESAHVKINLKIGISGSPGALDRFSATVHFIRNWYKVISILTGILLLPVGIMFFAGSTNGTLAMWRGPWMIMVISTAAGIYVRSLNSMVEGMGFVAESIQVNLWGGVVQIVVTIIGLSFGLKLYSVPIASAVSLIINYIFVHRLLSYVERDTRGHGNEIRINWLRDILPFQWRIALSWLSGWFIFSAMMPVVFRHLGPEEAGRFGLAMSMYIFINTFAINWTSTKSAIWGQMASRKDWRSMDSLFWKVMPQAVGIATLGSVIALTLVPIVKSCIPRFAGRLPEVRVLFFLCSVAIMNQVVFAEAFYLRAHKREPLLANSIFSGVAMAVGLFYFSHTSTLYISIIYFLVTFVGLIWGSIVFLYCRNRWHSYENVFIFDKNS